jgi:hypothetical protein
MGLASQPLAPEEARIVSQTGKLIKKRVVVNDSLVELESLFDPAFLSICSSTQEPRAFST